MTKPEKLEAIRRACIAANPSKEHFCCKHSTVKMDEYCDDCLLSQYPKIGLADVLLATNKRSEIAVTNFGGWVKNIRGYGPHHVDGRDWNLRTDDLTAQSEECVDFLFSLVGSEGVQAA